MKGGVVGEAGEQIELFSGLRKEGVLGSGLIVQVCVRQGIVPPLHHHHHSLHLCSVKDAEDVDPIMLLNKLCSCHFAGVLLLLRLSLCHFLSSHIQLS